ncbi:hypothetical protein [Olsenella porci]|nr:hypothetical protein [Olsenella porci]
MAGLPAWFSTDGIGILGPAPLGLLACIPTLLLCAWILVGASKHAPSGVK